VLASHSSDFLWLLVPLSSLFYSLILFDTLGDAVGAQRAYWVLIVMAVLPGVLYVLWLLLDRWQPSAAMGRVISMNTFGVELRDSLLSDSNPLYHYHQSQDNNIASDAVAAAASCVRNDDGQIA
jgi:hypothetical protein